jgi:DNA-binding NarL/FixJ family response regulator
MPKMNGIDFLRKVNEIYGQGKTPVIITSNIASLEQISEGVSLGIRGYIVKSNESLHGIVSAVEGILA